LSEFEKVFDEVTSEVNDLTSLPSVEVITIVAVEMLTVAGVKCGLAEDGRPADLDEARKLINATAGLITASAAEIGDHHARPLREALRQVQLAFREASVIPDAPGQGPGEKYTGPVN
jgi:hypothetical protein